MFELISKYKPAGDQPEAIKELVEGINEGKRDQVLLGATGTGKTATDDQANEVCTFIRKTIADLFGQEAADKVRIQYGGSVKPATISNLMAKSDIDGALVGGASLKAEDFSQIVKF